MGPSAFYHQGGRISSSSPMEGGSMRQVSRSFSQTQAARVADHGRRQAENQGDRTRLLSSRGIALIDTRQEPDTAEIIDLVSCTEAGKRSCFVLARWQEERLVQAELFFTEAEARASLAHGNTFLLEEFALPPSILACM